MKILNYLLKFSNKILCNGKTYKEYYINVNKLIKHFHDNKIAHVSFNDKLSFHNKILIFLTITLHSCNLSLFDDENSDIFIDDMVLEKILKNVQIKIYNDFKTIPKSIIIYKFSNCVSKTSLDKINEFYQAYQKMFKKICDKQDTVIIKDLDCIYFYYFIPIILKNSYQISYNGDGLLITDDYTDSADNQIFIGSKFSNVYPESKNGLFYSYTLNQFLLKNVVSDSKKIIGKLMKFYRIETLENSKVLIYNGNVLKMPKTYNFISESMLAITKKNSKITIKNNFSQINEFNNIEKYYNDYEFSKLLFFKCIAVPSNKILENLFKIVINTFPQLDAKNYQEINSNNIYSFNNGLAPQFSIFSLYVLGNNIVIQISRNFLSIEKQLIKLIDSNLNNLFQHKDITVEPVSNMQNFKKIHIISEMRFMIQVFTKIFPFLVRNFFDANISNNNNYYNLKRKQYVYTFSQSEIALIKKKSEKCGLKPINLIRSSIIKAIYNLFENHLVDIAVLQE